MYVLKSKDKMGHLKDEIVFRRFEQAYHLFCAMTEDSPHTYFIYRVVGDLERPEELEEVELLGSHRWGDHPMWMDSVDGDGEEDAKNKVCFDYSFKIPDDVFQELLALCLEENKYIHEVINDVLRNYLLRKSGK